MQPSKFVILLLERKIQTRGILGSQNRVDFAKFYLYLTAVIIYINTMKTTFYLNLAILPFFKTAETQKHVNKINNFLLFTCKLWKLEKCLLGIKAFYKKLLLLYWYNHRPLYKHKQKQIWCSQFLTAWLIDLLPKIYPRFKDLKIRIYIS